MLAGHEAGDRVLELRAGERPRRGAPVRRRRAQGARLARAARLHRRPASATRAPTAASSWAPRPRSGLLLLRAAKARALIDGRDHALPDDVQALAQPVLTHRIMLVPEAAGVERSAIVADAIAATPAL